MIRIPQNRKPTHPGEMLLNEFLEPHGLTQIKLAQDLKIPFQRINEIVNEKRGITPSTALKLEKYFGNSASFWLNMQLRIDLYRARLKDQSALDEIKPLVSNL